MTAYLPSALIQHIEKYDFSRRSLYDVFEHGYPIKITKEIRTIQTILAKDDVANHLEILEGLSILLFYCTICSEVDGKQIPAEAFECYDHSDKV